MATGIGVAMSAVEELVQNPSEVLLDACSKDQLLKVAWHFEIEITIHGYKDCILGIVKESLVQLGVLSAVVKGTDSQGAVTPLVSLPVCKICTAYSWG